MTVKPTKLYCGTLNWGPKGQTDEGISLADLADTEGNRFMLSASLNT